LKMKDHIEERTKEITKAPVVAGAGAGSPEK
jgi:hypothetical protein